MFSNEEIQLEFKRFPAEKQEQIRQLVAYTTLMGLDGKDLISIGSRLNRIVERNEILKNRKIVEEMTIRTIGHDRDFYSRCAYTSADGTVYHIDQYSYSRSRISNTKTKHTKVISMPSYDDRYKVGRWSFKGSSLLPSIMLEIHYGKVQLP
jgi:hypothetical protein